MSTNMYKQSDSKQSNRHTGKMEHGKIFFYIGITFLLHTVCTVNCTSTNGYRQILFNFLF